MTPMNTPIPERHSTHRRIFLLFTLFTGLLCAAFTFVSIRSDKTRYEEHHREKAKLLAFLLAGRIPLPLYAESSAELRREARDMFTVPNVARVEVFNNRGDRLVDEPSEPPEPGHQLISASAPVTPGRGIPSPEEALGDTRTPPPAPLGSVTVTVDLRDQASLTHAAIIRTIGMALLFWGIVVAACYPLLRRMVRSFEILTAGISAIEQGNVPALTETAEPGEAGQAASAVIRLATVLRDREEETRALHRELVDAIETGVQEAHRKLMARLIQTNRMTSLGLIISSMAHNIHTPNGAIMLSAQFLQAAWKDTLPLLEGVSREEGDFIVGGLPFSAARDEVREAGETILSNAGRIEKVIQDLRMYNIGAGKAHEPGVDLNRVVRDALTVIRAHGSNGDITVSPDLAPDLPGITGNHHQLEQVVINLILNAIQATPPGGEIVTVRTRHESEERRVLMTIRDHGEGISPEAVHHLFEPFFSTKIERGGSGLGLYISSFIISEHHGSLALEPAPQGGTEATIRLPESPEKSCHQGAPAPLSS